MLKDKLGDEAKEKKTEVTYLHIYCKIDQKKVRI